VRHFSTFPFLLFTPPGKSQVKSEEKAGYHAINFGMKKSDGMIPSKKNKGIIPALWHQD